MIEASHLSKTYGSVKAVADVSFQVARGEVVGFLGPNGAGKSTTLRMLAGFLGPTSGTVRIGGHDLAADPIAARRQVGYMPETAPLYPEMRVGEYLAFRAELKGLPRPDRRPNVKSALRQVNIGDVEDVVIGHLSKGYRQRVALADALVAKPPILVLDEPTAGLDPNQIRDVRDLIRELGKERAILLSTHILSEIEATCSRALVISRGRLVATGSIDEIRALRQGAGARVVVRGEEKAARGAAKRVKGVSRVKAEPGDRPGTVSLAIEIDREADAAATVEEVVAALCTAGLGVSEVGAVGDSLEQVFADLTMENGK
jgi:ABC-2 type transport system ATP-binding protein